MKRSRRTFGRSSSRTPSLDFFFFRNSFTIENMRYGSACTFIITQTTRTGPPTISFATTDRFTLPRFCRGWAFGYAAGEKWGAV